jgi:cytosol alanyl aminopeptidase
MQLRLSLVLALAAGCAGAPRTQPPSAPEPSPLPAPVIAATPAPLVPPALRLPDTVRPLRYRAALTIDTTATTFAGEVAIDIDVRVASDVVWLHAHDLTLESAVLERGDSRVPLVAAYAPNDFLALRAAAPIAPGAARVVLQYRGRVRPDEKGGVSLFADGEQRYVVTHFEPRDARRAFPCFDEPGFKVPWQLSLRVRPGQLAFSNTAEIGSRDDGEWKVVDFAETAPLPSYLIAFAVGPFEVVDAGRTAAGTPLRIVVPAGRAPAASYAKGIVGRLQEVLEAYTGIPYPYGKMDHLAYPGYGGAMEHVGMVTYGETALLIPELERGVKREEVVASIAAHELAHQWFGNIVTPAWWDDLWLNESFASWAEQIALAGVAPEWNVPAMQAWARHGALAADAVASARKIHNPADSYDDVVNAFDSITYAKGSAVLTMIEHWLGTERFRTVIRNHLNAHRDGTATYADFASALAGVSGDQARAVLDSFVDQPGAPRLEMAVRCERGRTPEVALAQSRFARLGARTPREGRWSIPVCVRWGAGGATGRACTLLSEAAGTLVLDGARSCPDWVAPNAGGRGYYRAALDVPALARLTRHLGALDAAETIALASDVEALVGSGDAPVAAALDLVAALARRRDRASLEAAMALLLPLDSAVVDADRPRWRAWVAAQFARAYRRLGMTPRRGESRDVAMARVQVIKAMGQVAADRKVLAQARALAVRWLADPAAVPGELLDTVLVTASIHGDRELHARLVAAATATTSMKQRSRLLMYLGRFRDPALVEANLALALADTLPAHTTEVLVWRSGWSRATAGLGYQFLRARWDAFLGRLPRDAGAGLSFIGAATCDPDLRDEVELFFRERSAKRPGGPRLLAQSLEEMDACIAWDRANRDALSAYLAKRRG